MLQEPNAPPSYPRRFFPRALPSSTFRTQTPSFPPLFLRLPPFFCFAVPCGTTYPVAAPSLNSFIRSRRATPRTCQQRLENSTKCFTPLLLLPLPSHRRNNEYSYGLNFWWNRPLRVHDPPSSAIPLSVAAFLRQRYSAILVRRVRVAWKHRDFSSYISISSGTRPSWTKSKSAHLGKVERAITRTLSYAKSKGRPRRLLFRVSNIQKRYNIYNTSVSTWRWKKS